MKVEIDREELRQLFDLIVHSLDFGSGFLETDDVNLLRGIAETIGVHPMEATPREFAAQYPHTYKEWRPEFDRCSYCNEPQSAHSEGEAA